MNETKDIWEFFSPPFADQLSKGTDPEKFNNKGNWNVDESYSEDKDNIGNMKYGDPND